VRGIDDQMSTIDDLQGRLSAAMDRLAQGVERLQAAPAGPDPETQRALEEERTANAQLQERVRALKSRAEAESASLRAQLEEAQARMTQLDTELQRVRRANGQLTEACAALIEANEEGVSEPQLINKAMLAELEGLRAARAAESAEAGAILAALTPLVEAAHREEEAG
jgi:chromosome segregation ATPase